MESILDYKGDRGLRLLDIFERLNRGELLNKRELTKYYGVGEKTIQRDIEDIRNYLADRRDAHDQGEDRLCRERVRTEPAAEYGHRRTQSRRPSTATGQG